MLELETELTPPHQAADELILFCQNWQVDNRQELLADGEIRTEGRKALRQIITEGDPVDRYTIKRIITRAGIVGFSPDEIWSVKDWELLEQFIRDNWPEAEASALTF